MRLRTVEQHLDEILGAVPQPAPIELAVLDAQGLLCAELVTSSRALPAFDQAGLDGYAVRAADIGTATVERPTDLVVRGGEPRPARARPPRSAPAWRRRSPSARCCRPAPTSSSRPRGPTRARPGCRSTPRSRRAATCAGSATTSRRATPPCRSAPRSGRRRSACSPPSAGSGSPSGRGRGSRCCAPGRSWSTSAPPSAPGSRSTSTATRWPPRPATPAPRPTAPASCPTTSAGWSS